MRLQRQTRDSSERLHNRSSNGDVGNEVSVHHIDMDSISASPLGLGHLLTQTRKVGGKNRRSQFDDIVSHASVLSSLAHRRGSFVTCVFKDVHKFSIAAGNLRDGRFAFDLLRPHVD